MRSQLRLTGYKQWALTTVMTVTQCPHLSKMASTPRLLYLPETLTNWPWPRVIRPEYEEVAAESHEWVKSFQPFDEKSQYAFEKCNFGPFFCKMAAKSS